MKLLANRERPPLLVLVAAEICKIHGGQISIEWTKQDTQLELSKNIVLDSASTVCRYLARKQPQSKLYGSNDLEASEIDHWVEIAGRISNNNAYPVCVEKLDKALDEKDVLVGKDTVTLADIACWASLHDSKKWNGEFKTGKVPLNVIRWYNTLNETATFKTAIDSIPKATPNKPVVKQRKEEGKYIDLPGAEMGKVVVRFPPEASGYLHIGHAKAALLNAYYQKLFQGKLIMRFDDTNPAKEKEDYEKAILEDLEMLKIKPDTFSHTSDHFDEILKLCERLIGEGKAYVDDTDSETMKKEREERKECANRANNVDRNMEMWSEMIRGTESGQRCAVRAKISMQSNNGCLRDPTIYRCKNEPHIRTGTRYKVYPTYDFACPIVDSIEGVTHALRTTEYHDRDDQYFWFLEQLQLRKPHLYEYSRLNLQHTVLSKRRLAWFVEEGIVSGWDDPRFPTVRGVMRRGMTVEGLQEFIFSQGSSRAIVFMEWDKIWSLNKKVIDPAVPRYTALDVSQLVTMTINGAVQESKQVPAHPKCADIGDKAIWYGPSIFIEKVDADSIKEGDVVTLINWGNVKVTKVNAATSVEGVSVEADLNLENTDYKKTTKLTWLANTPQAFNVSTVCQTFGHLITAPIIPKEDDFKQYANKDSKSSLVMLGDPCLAQLKKGDIIQLQRKGFFICDSAYEPISASNSRAKPCTLIAIPDGHQPNKGSNVDAKPQDGRSGKKAEKTAKIAADPERVSGLHAKVQMQADVVRALKVDKAPKDKVDVEVAELIALKKEYKLLTGLDWKSDTASTCDNRKRPAFPKSSTNPKAKAEVQASQGRASDAANDGKGDVDKKVANAKKSAGGDTDRKGKKDDARSDKESKEQAKNKAKKPEADEGKKLSRLGLEVTKEGNFSEWYTQMITKSELIEYYDVSGCYILRPWSYAIWEMIKDWFDKSIKKLGVQNVYFPIFVSQAALEREKEHIADFAPEVAWVTRSGNTELAEPIAIRPTSETVMYPAYARWIQSHRDLPLKLNQWNNVVRWEFKHPQPFLRTREFLWQEGHTAFATKEEATDEVYTILDLYAGVYEQLLAIPVIKGTKTEKEKFAGGDFTTTCEVLIKSSGRAIQGATSHHLGQNFSRMFNIVFEDPEKPSEHRYVYQNSWGLTTRTIGVMAMVHGDDKGLVLPPRVAPLQAVIVPCGITASTSGDERSKLMAKCSEYEERLSGSDVRVKGDYRDNYSPGWKFNHWELKGVPIRIEVGPRDLAANVVTIVTRFDGAKSSLSDGDVEEGVKRKLEEIHNHLLDRQRQILKENVSVTRSWDEFCANLDLLKLNVSPFCQNTACEDLIKQESASKEAEEGAPAMGAKSLCIPFKQPEGGVEGVRCIHPRCEAPAVNYTMFGRSY